MKCRLLHGDIFILKLALKLFSLFVAGGFILTCLLKHTSFADWYHLKPTLEYSLPLLGEKGSNPILDCEIPMFVAQPTIFLAQITSFPHQIPVTQRFSSWNREIPMFYPFVAASIPLFPWKFPATPPRHQELHLHRHVAQKGEAPGAIQDVHLRAMAAMSIWFFYQL